MPKIQRNSTVEPTKASLEGQLAAFNFLLAGNIDDDNIEVKLPRDETLDVVDENKPVVGFKQSSDMSGFASITDRLQVMMDNNIEPIVLVGEESFIVTPTKQDSKVVEKDDGADIGSIAMGAISGGSTGALAGSAGGVLGAGIGGVAGGLIGGFAGSKRKKKKVRGLGVYSKQIFVRKTPDIFPVLDESGLPKYSINFTSNKKSSVDPKVEIGDVDYGVDFISIFVDVSMPAVSADEYFYLDVIAEFLCRRKI